MGAHLLDTYSHLQSPVHLAPAGLKLAIALGLIIANVTVPVRVWPWFVFSGLIVLAMFALSRIPRRFVFFRLLLIEPFAIGVAILTLFQPGGLGIFLGILLKTTLCLLTMILLANSTPFTDLLQLLRRLRLPMLLITTLALMYRYLFIILDESTRMRRARRARTFIESREGKFQRMASVLAMLFIRTSDRSERTYRAMCSRGWG